MEVCKYDFSFYVMYICEKQDPWLYRDETCEISNPLSDILTDYGLNLVKDGFKMTRR